MVTIFTTWFNIKKILPSTLAEHFRVLYRYQKTPITSLYKIKWAVSLKVKDGVYYAVRAEYVSN